VPIVLKSGSLNHLEPSGPVKACNGIALPLTLPRYITVADASIELASSIFRIITEKGEKEKEITLYLHLYKDRFMNITKQVTDKTTNFITLIICNVPLRPPGRKRKQLKSVRRVGR
jgi:hypothetical protein